MIVDYSNSAGLGFYVLTTDNNKFVLEIVTVNFVRNLDSAHFPFFLRCFKNCFCHMTTEKFANGYHSVLCIGKLVYLKHIANEF